MGVLCFAHWVWLREIENYVEIIIVTDIKISLENDTLCAENSTATKIVLVLEVQKTNVEISVKNCTNACQLYFYDSHIW